MKKNVDKYPVADKLPDNAVTVKEYSDLMGISTAWIYKCVKLGKNNEWDMVVFHGVNFIIPRKS